MVVTLLLVGITMLVVLLSIYFHFSPVQPTTNGPAQSAQRSLSHIDVRKQDETEQGQVSGIGNEGTVPPVDISLGKSPLHVKVYLRT